MPTVPPPSRYRVVERGRRLEVIDTLDADRVVAAPTVPALPGRSFTTRAFFDEKAPRTIVLDDAQRDRLIKCAALAVAGLWAAGTAVWVTGFPGLFVAALALGFARRYGRGWATRAIDRLAGR